MDVEQAEILARLIEDLPVFSENNLVILDKSGVRRPLIFNKAQEYVHERLEEQKRRTGKVRALIVKGRQQGISTYVSARYYHRTSFGHGQRALIVAHEQKATDNLFNLVKRYHDGNPLAPVTEASNAKELIFSGLDSGYRVATAGTKDVGRSSTFQLLHRSEFAFWQHAELHQAGLGQTLPDADGSEDIIESTGNGIGSPFHQMWQLAEEGKGEYIAIFVPWFWQAEYTADVPKDFVLSEEDIQYRDAYKLTMGQMAWRRNKIDGFGTGREWMFDQEYPATPALAFQTPTNDPFINPNLVSAAMSSDYRDDDSPLVIGVDPADQGDDRTAICFRRGRMVFRMETYEKKTTMQVAGIVAKIIAEHHPDAVFVDAVGIGAGIADRLRELGHPVIKVLSGAGAYENKIYANKRAEMWARMRAWLEDAPCRLLALPAFASDLSGPETVPPDSSGRMLIEKKTSMKARGVRSPDLADALALTFAEYIGAKGAGEFRRGNSGQVAATSAGY